MIVNNCKIFAVASAVMFFTDLTLLALTPANQALYDEINSAWSDQNYPAIKTVVDSRLQADSADILALAIKQFYYIFAEIDVPQAKQAANAILAQTNLSPDDRVQKLGVAITEKVLQASSSAEPYTPEQKAKIHELMPNYPMIDQCFVLWERATGQEP